jgi:predicted ArsR family transcriptional regulator
MNTEEMDQQLAGVPGLADPIRRALYRHVAASGVAVGRDEAARATGIGRSLAGYHLDRLVDDGLLEARFERRSGRSGPGAGRPAKVYLRAPREIEVSLPARDYAGLAEVLARALEADPSGSARTALARAAHDFGDQLGAEAAARTTPEAGGEDVLAAVRDTLAERGYEPYDERPGVIRLRNCPFHRLAASHRDLVCGANLAMIEGLAEQLGGTGQVGVRLDPRPGECCVTVSAGDAR